ncbi:MAG TPA: P1 family peptidase [Woeseiaceae bacterium]|nr:P1 family peptidase [Woeseiaceae bacterium]
MKAIRVVGSVPLFVLLVLLGHAGVANAAEPRARDLGIPFDGTPGTLNAITDVAGVTVGQHTIIRDLPDNRAVRTGVTAVLPRGRATSNKPVFAAWFPLNGNGEMTGTAWVDESGFLEGPVLITNTHSVGAVHQAAIRWRVQQGSADDSGYWWSLPVVAETWDGYLNDVNGFHVQDEHVFAALEDARGGAVAEGNVGGGTGMICHEFKCGIGTASRLVALDDGTFTIGVLVQANYGLRDTLRIAGVPVGQILTEHRLYAGMPGPAAEQGSIIIVVATDAPLLPHQLERLVKRAALGVARVGGTAGNGSGDIFIAFSTANENAGQTGPVMPVRMLANDNISPLFQGTVEATEEAIVNALIAARDMTGDQGHTAYAIDHDALLRVLREYQRLNEPAGG